jgi:hypothetical protein
MLFLLFHAAFDLPISVDVAGMEPQIEILRRDAAEHGWPITCEGRAGEERVLRLTFPRGASGAAIRTYFDAEHHIGSSTRFYHRRDLPPVRCDQEPPRISASAPIHILGFGPSEALARLASVARACGFTRAVVREPLRGDTPAGTARLHDGLRALDAGEDITRSYGQTICFIQMRTRALEPLQPRAR